MRETPYERYLHLPELLSLQVPQTGPDTELRASESFFIVVHQAAELCVGQAVQDVRRVAVGVRDAEPAEQLIAPLRRSVATLGLVTDLLKLMDHLPVGDFHGFRGALGDASACQSRQFAELFALVQELADSTPPVAPHAPDSPRSDPCSAPPHAQLLQGTRELVDAVCRWRAEHLSLVRRMIGDAPGTGGTSGADYLSSTLAAARAVAPSAAGSAACPMHGPAPAAESGALVRRPREHPRGSAA